MPIGLMYFLLWLIIANAVGFNLMYRDKNSAKIGGWRVKESHLFLTALFFGALSIYVSMYVLRHKIRKFYFKYGMILMIVENLVMGLAIVLMLII